MKVELTRTANIQTYDVKIGERELMGEITNKTQNGAFQYETTDCTEQFSAEELQAISLKLNELNN